MLQKVMELVRQAGKIMLLDRFTVEEKDSCVNVVTSADLAVQHFLEEKLTALLPDSGIFGEEEHQQDLSHPNTWVIDPIDGTCNFTRHMNQSAISVGLLVDRVPELGVVYNPFLDEMFYAQRGKGAFLNGKPIHVADTSFEKGILCTAMSLYRKEFAPVCFDIIRDAYDRCNDVRRFGTCALELCYLAAGRCDLYFEIRVFPWDYAAGQVILQEAGGVLTGLGGTELTHDCPTALIGANSRENFAVLSDIVSAHLTALPYGKEL